MKKVKFVEKLVIREVLAANVVEYHQVSRPFTVSEDGTMLCDVKVDKIVVPVSRFCSNGEPDRYIAWSREVEEYLNIPFRALQRRIESLENKLQINETNLGLAKIRLAEYRAMGFWKRVLHGFK